MFSWDGQARTLMVASILLPIALEADALALAAVPTGKTLESFARQHDFKATRMRLSRRIFFVFTTVSIALCVINFHGEIYQMKFINSAFCTRTVLPLTPQDHVKISTRSIGAIALYENVSLTSSGAVDVAQFKTPLRHFPRPTNEFQLLILVTSSATPLGAERRNGIRRTWHSKWHNVTPALPVWGTFFLLGQTNDTNVMGQLYGEADEHKDLIIGDFVDHFYNLSIKVMVGFEWASQFASSSSYILKLDDDVFPILPNVFAFLFDKETPRNGLYAGNVQFDAVPLRFGKYSVSREEYARRYYPRYVSGGGILLSMDVATGMVDAYNMSDCFKIDDVYFGMLAQRIGVDPFPGATFRVFRPESGHCIAKVDSVVEHGYGVPRCLKRGYDRSFQHLDSQMKTFADNQALHQNLTSSR